MSNLFRLGSMALSNAQQAINTTGHNIANVSTDGYSRQSVRFEPQAAVQRGSSFVGQGARFAGITRNTNAYVNGQIRQFSSSAARVDTENSYLARLDQLIASSGNNVGSAIQNFLNANQELANNPAGLPERQALLGQAQAMLTQARAIDGAFTELENELNSQFRNGVDEVNRLADGIAMLNNRIQALSGGTAQSQPNDLLDQRELLLRELSGKIGIQVLARDDGTMDVYVAQGQSLVQGSSARALQVTVAAQDRRQLDVGFADAPGQRLRDLAGGELAGLQDLRERVLLPAQRRLGVLMLNLTTAFNEVHAQGIDLSGVPGAEFFALDDPLAESSTANTGSAVLTASVQDSQQLRTSRYRAEYDGSNWTLTRLVDGTAVSGAALASLSLDGLALTVASGSANAGDRFEIDPGRSAIQGLDLLLTNASRIAAARLDVATAPAPGNSGTLELGSSVVTDPASFLAEAPVTITYGATTAPGPAPGMLISWGTGSLVVPYDPASNNSNGKQVTVPDLGWSFVLSSVPADGDSLQVSAAAIGRGDNRNALALADLQRATLAANGQRRLTEEYSALASSIGVAARQASSSLETENSLLAQAEVYRDNSSGVNLDEEFSNLLRFQQYYQASAQLLRVADTLFQSLISSL